MRPHRAVRRRVAVAWGGALAAALLGGCVTTDQSGPAPPSRTVGGPERSLTPQYMVAWADQATDVEGDGRPDRLAVGFQLFAEDPDPVSVVAEGSLEVTMTHRDRTLKIWDIPPERVAQSVQTRGVQARYLITLFLPEADTVERLPRRAMLRIRFKPRHGSEPLERYLGAVLRPG